jgi:protein SCO1/2
MRSAALSIGAAAIALSWATVGWTHEGPHALKPASARSDAAASQVSIVKGVRYALPDVRVVDTQGRTMQLADHFDTADVLLLNFVFTTCSTICSTQTAVLSETQRRLLASGRRARFVTVTIDPDNDTPERLAAFARQFDITRDWSFLTGSFDDLVRVQEAFNVYRGAKAAHPPVVIVRLAKGAAWVRVEGIASPTDLLAVFDHQRSRD